MQPTPLVKAPLISGFSGVYVKDESSHPTGTFKDRLIRRAVERTGADVVLATISYGNTALALAHAMSSAPGRTAAVLVPPDLADWTLGPSTSGRFVSGRDVLEVLRRSLHVLDLPLDGTRLDDDAIEAIVRRELGTRAPVMNITEGLDVPAYVDIIVEAVDQLGRVPAAVLVPFGAGILCNEIRDFLADERTHVIALSVAERDSPARMLYGPFWVDVAVLAAEGVAPALHVSPDRTGAERRPYPVHRVMPSEIAEGLQLARSMGLSAEPSAVVGLAILNRLGGLLPGLGKDDDIIVVSTGNSLDPLADT